MPKAEVGSSKWLANNMKSKGLQRLRWYCQVCERQMRDENGFKQHTLSEGHVRAMLAVGEDPRKYINDYSNQFRRDFLRLLKTAHGEKKVHANNFYQEYISDKQHVHMNSTKWPSLTEFVKQLSREGICRVEEGERGLEIAWIDDSPEALRRKDAVMKRDRMERGDEERQTRILEAQIKRANEQKAQALRDDANVGESLNRDEGQTITFSLGGATEKQKDSKPAGKDASDEDGAARMAEVKAAEPAAPMPAQSTAPKVVSLDMGGKKAPSKSFNVFSTKSNALKQQKSAPIAQEPKKMSILEEIMLRDKEEQERKRGRHGHGSGAKRQRLG